MSKISIRFFADREVRAVWDDTGSKWWFSVMDIIGVLRGEDNYEKNRNYWKFLKAKLKREYSELGSVTTQFRFTAPGGKKRLANVLDSPTKREERNQYAGSIPERVPGKQGEIPRPFGRKRRQSLRFPGLALGY